MNLLDDIQTKAKAIGGTVVFPEGDEPRMMHAAEIIVNKGLAKVIIVGNKDSVNELAKSEDADISGAEISDPEKDARRDDFAMKFWEMRKHKGVTLYQAKEMMKNPLYWGAMLVREGFANSAVAGAENTTGNVLRAAIHCIGTANGVSVVSSSFLMVLLF